uniref:Uncharacterized protein n=1 Tax=Desertifilum tharense IPPAS B-1220 TaxID=1781255 RepID=A0ACD5GVX6_9CYAN
MGGLWLIAIALPNLPFDPRGFSIFWSLVVNFLYNWCTVKLRTLPDFGLGMNKFALPLNNA